ncbi:MAG TPA: hypothetical protein P5228_00345 [Bacteroidales bacterium]|nr:hypothetical protein [Bacteroidales bacterium]HRZ47879.1 hypothetical protein [Bacteroidales bacterium]
MTKTDKPAPPRPVQIPKEGALGILALGAAGLRAWREVKAAAGQAEPQSGKAAKGTKNKGE